MAHREIIRVRPPSLLDRVRDTLRSYRIPGISLKDPKLAEFYANYRGGTSAGVSVTEANALQLAAVWQAVTLIAGDVGSLPLLFYKTRKDGGRERYPEHPLYKLLHDAPNPEMSAMTFRETLQGHLLTWGNGYAEIERDGGGRPVALWPMLPNAVQPFRNERKQLQYRVANPNGTQIILDKADVLHIPGLGFDGTVGYSVITQARESLGLLSAAEKFGGTFFGNGTAFGGALTHPKTLGTEAQSTLRSSIESLHRGPEKAHRFLILEEGMSYQQFGIAPNDAQFLETRQFQIAEVARWFNLPLHKLREMKDSSVRANIEQESLDYYVSTLRPWLTRWEQEIQRKLVSPREQNIQYAEFLLDGVLRGDLASRYAAYAVGRQWGWLSQNDIRQKENMNPIPGGDRYLSPTNMTPSDRLDEVIDKQVEPDPAPVAPAADEKSPADDSEAEREALTALLVRVESQATTIGELQAKHGQALAVLDAERTEGARLRGLVVERTANVDAVVGERDAALAKADQAWAMLAEGLGERDTTRAVLANAEARTTNLEQIVAELSQTENELRAELATTVEKSIEADRLAAVQVDAVRADADRAAKEWRNAEQARHEALLRVTSAEQKSEHEGRRAQEATTLAQEARTEAETAKAAQAAAEALAATQAATHAERLAALVTAQRAVVQSAMQRLIGREVDKAKSKRATPAKLAGWLDTFYDDYEADVWVDALRAPMAVHLLLVGSDLPAEDVARELVRAHFDASTEQMRAVVANDEFDAAFTATVNRWESQRAAQLADAFVREEIAYVRSI